MGQIGSDTNVVFANSAAANTQATAVTFNVSQGSVNEYSLIVDNPSTVTDLTCKVFSVEVDLDSTNDRDALITTISIPKAQTLTGTAIQTHHEVINGCFSGGQLKLQFSNDTILGGSDGFTATVRLKENLASRGY